MESPSQTRGDVMLWLSNERQDDLKVGDKLVVDVRVQYWHAKKWHPATFDHWVGGKPSRKGLVVRVEDLPHRAPLLITLGEGLYRLDTMNAQMEES